MALAKFYEDIAERLTDALSEMSESLSRDIEKVSLEDMKKWQERLKKDLEVAERLLNDILNVMTTPQKLNLEQIEAMERRYEERLQERDRQLREEIKKIQREKNDFIQLKKDNFQYQKQKNLELTRENTKLKKENAKLVEKNSQMVSQIQQLNRLRNSEAALQKLRYEQSKKLRDLTQKLEKTQKENKSLAEKLETEKNKRMVKTTKLDGSVTYTEFSERSDTRTSERQYFDYLQRVKK
ncbi:hypothetical protein [Moraxella sp. RCAD0137]|uniref:hypothetical protein n=1 Tax=Moraxella sp. RCAD0137 TaxID=1775913 RepID=UPI000C9FEB7B|nr:hypothetical protein [Moraxella sp. RCAD0137]PNP96964.1 hypothetical protein AZ602_08690 [Moraxella sp. RCAD0137]